MKADEPKRYKIAQCIYEHDIEFFQRDDEYILYVYTYERRKQYAYIDTLSVAVTIQYIVTIHSTSFSFCISYLSV